MRTSKIAPMEPPFASGTEADADTLAALGEALGDRHLDTQDVAGVVVEEPLGADHLAVDERPRRCGDATRRPSTRSRRRPAPSAGSLELIRELPAAPECEHGGGVPRSVPPPSSSAARAWVASSFRVARLSRGRRCERRGPATTCASSPACAAASRQRGLVQQVEVDRVAPVRETEERPQLHVRGASQAGRPEGERLGGGWTRFRASPASFATSSGDRRRVLVRHLRRLRPVAAAGVELRRRRGPRRGRSGHTGKATTDGSSGMASIRSAHRQLHVDLVPVTPLTLDRGERSGSARRRPRLPVDAHAAGRPAPTRDGADAARGGYGRSSRRTSRVRPSSGKGVSWRSVRPFSRQATSRPGTG